MLAAAAALSSCSQTEEALKQCFGGKKGDVSGTVGGNGGDEFQRMVKEEMSKEETTNVTDMFNDELLQTGYTCDARVPTSSFGSPQSAPQESSPSTTDVTVYIRPREPVHEDPYGPPCADLAQVCAGIRRAQSSVEKRFPGRCIGIEFIAVPSTLNALAQWRSLSDVLITLARLQKENACAITAFSVRGDGAKFRDDNTVPAAAVLPHLRTLNVNDSNANDTHLQHAATMAPEVSALHVSGTQVSMDGIRHFPHLKELGIAETPILAEDALTKWGNTMRIHVDDDQQSMYEEHHGPLKLPGEMHCIRKKKHEEKRQREDIAQKR